MEGADVKCDNSFFKTRDYNKHKNIFVPNVMIFYFAWKFV